MKRKLTDAQRQKIEDARQALAMVGDQLNRQLAAERVTSSIGDAIPAALMQRSLEYAVSQGIMEATTETVWREVFPIDRDMPKGANVKIYTIWSGSAIAEWYRSGKEHPNVAIGSKQVPIYFNSMDLAFTIDQLEMMASDYAGVNVEAEKAAQVFIGFDEAVEEIMFIGDSTMNYVGLIDHTNITSGNCTNGAWDDDTLTEAQRAAAIMQDVKDVITAIVEANPGNKKLKGKKIDFMLSPGMYRLATSTIANTYTNETVEAVLAKTDQKFGRFIESPMHGETDGGAGDYLSAGPFSDINSICVPISMDAERMLRHDKGMVWEQPFITKFAALHVKEPLFFYQGEGLLDTE
jgi:hypothetical protein